MRIGSDGICGCCRITFIRVSDADEGRAVHSDAAGRIDNTGGELENAVPRLEVGVLGKGAGEAWELLRDVSDFSNRSGIGVCEQQLGGARRHARNVRQRVTRKHIDLAGGIILRENLRIRRGTHSLQIPFQKKIIIIIIIK